MSLLPSFDYPLEELYCSSPVFDIVFHPKKKSLLAAALVTGQVEFHSLPTCGEVYVHLENCHDDRLSAWREERARRRKEKAEEQKKEKPCLSSSLDLNQHLEDDEEEEQEEESVSTDRPFSKKKRRKVISKKKEEENVLSTSKDEEEGSEEEQGGESSSDDASLEKSEDEEEEEKEEGEEEDEEDSEDDDDGVLDRRKYLKEDLKTFSTKVKVLKKHKRGCRSICFSLDGRSVYTASTDGTIVQSNVEGGETLWKSPPQSDAINVISILSENVVAGGDDGGVISLWDVREGSTAASTSDNNLNLTKKEKLRKPIMRFHDHEDFISDITTTTASSASFSSLEKWTKKKSKKREEESSESSSSPSSSSSLPTHLVATGGDMLAVFDLRRRALYARSDPFEEDFHCVQIMRNGSKAVCGCEDGSLGIFTWGDFGDVNDRLTGHRQSVDCMVKLNEDFLLTGCADGLVRLVQILPNEIVGVLGTHTLTADSPSTSELTRASSEIRQGGVDRLALCSDKSLLAGVSSFDEKITILQLEPAWKLLEKKGEDESGEPAEEDGENISVKKKKRTKRKLVADLREGHDFFSDL